MKWKSWLKYFVISILIIFVIYCGDYSFDKMYSNLKFVIHPIYIALIFYISIGLLLGLEHLIQEINKKGEWRINTAKLALLGIPSLYFSFGLYLGLGKYLHGILTHPILMLISNHADFLSIFQIILGYSLITSFYKKVDNIRK